ncbi:MAG: hypothetical protein A2V88_08425 [Elusimicrobia bacterium RBG_16_66_12]|nr:MAG: hypothetical protein A2V88_08425 [Elusimicrobia bacterium RBG_16_66_12]
MEYATHKNPFKFGDPVEGEYYLARPGLSKIVHQFLDSKIHVVLLGPRRFGKTSFILDVLRHEEKKGKACLLIDIFNVTSHRDFLQQLLRALRSKQDWGAKLKKWFESAPRLRAKITLEVDPKTGQHSWGVSPDLAPEDVKEAIQDTIVALGEIGARVIIAIDEFQTIAELEDDGWLEATLRTQMQQIKNTSFLFSGSRRSVIHDMLNNASRPFYRSAQLIDFPTLGPEFTDWITKRFDGVGVACERGAIDELRREVQETPNYVQMACFHLVAQGTRTVDKRKIHEVLRTVVKQNAYAYQTLLNSLTQIQQRALRLAANNSEGIYAKDAIAKYEIPSGPTLASAIKALKQKQILDEGTAQGRVVFDDPLFSIWLKTEFPG